MRQAILDASCCSKFSMSVVCNQYNQIQQHWQKKMNVNVEKSLLTVPILNGGQLYCSCNCGFLPLMCQYKSSLPYSSSSLIQFDLGIVFFFLYCCCTKGLCNQDKITINGYVRIKVENSSCGLLLGSVEVVYDNEINVFRFTVFWINLHFQRSQDKCVFWLGWLAVLMLLGTFYL